MDDISSDEFEIEEAVDLESLGEHTESGHCPSQPNTKKPKSRSNHHRHPRFPQPKQFMPWKLYPIDFGTKNVESQSPVIDIAGSSSEGNTDVTVINELSNMRDTQSRPSSSPTDDGADIEVIQVCNRNDTNVKQVELPLNPDKIQRILTFMSTDKGRMMLEKLSSDISVEKEAIKSKVSSNEIPCTSNGNQSTSSSSSSTANGLKSSHEVKKTFYREFRPFHELMSETPRASQSRKPSAVIDLDDEDENKNNKSAPLSSSLFHPIKYPTRKEEIPQAPTPNIPNSVPDEKFKKEDVKISLLSLQGPPRMSRPNDKDPRTIALNVLNNLNFSYSNGGPPVRPPPPPLPMMLQTSPTSQIPFLNSPAPQSQFPNHSMDVRLPQERIPTNAFDAGLKLNCHICIFTANSHLLLIDHFVNEHQGAEPPCGLNTHKLNMVKNEKEETTVPKNKTGIQWIDDLNWIPNQRAFFKNIPCKMPNCNFSTNIRQTLINHIRNHQEEILKVPTRPVHLEYVCLMCGFVANTSEMFYEHCTGHTGEYMFCCGHCSVRTQTRKRLKSHNELCHQGRSLSVKANDKASQNVVDGVTYGFVCTACGFVQLNKSNVERHIAKSHPTHFKAVSLKFDFAVKERVPPTPKPPKPQIIPSTSSSINSKPTARKHSAAVKVKKTAISRQDMLTELIPAANKPAPSTSTRVSNEETADSDQVILAPSETAAEETDRLIPATSETPTGETDQLIPTTSETSPTPVVPELIIPETNLNVDEQMSVDDDDDDDDVDENRELTIDFEAVSENFKQNEISVKSENVPEDTESLETSCDPVVPSIEVLGSENLPTASLNDTITKLAAKLSVNERRTSGESSASFMPVISSIKSILDEKRIDWNERKNTVLCYCLKVDNGVNAFTLHWDRIHRNIRTSKCFECFKEFNSPQSYAEHRWKTCSKINDRIFVCIAAPNCRFLTSSKSKFEDHVRCEHDSADWFDCYWCSSKFTTGSSLITHISNCSSTNLIYKLNDAINNNETVIGEPVASSSSVDSVPPTLKVVYSCPVTKCSHLSLERRVFLEHMQRFHSAEKEIVCKNCGLNLENVESLVNHMEENHQDAPVNRREVRNSLIDTSRRNLPVQPPQPPAVPPPPPPPPPILEDENWLPGETEREYNLTSLDSMIKRVSLTFNVNRCNNSSGELEKKLQDWRRNKNNFNPPEIVDPLQVIHTRKEPDAIRCVIQSSKLRDLYKCGGKSCVFTTNVEGLFCNHLEMSNCRADSGLTCIYCAQTYMSIRDLAKHITKIHSQCIFQCPHCIYRAKKVLYVLIHMNKAHPELTGKVKVLKCPLAVSDELSVQDEDTVPELLTIIHPVSCVNECQFVSLDVATFLDHHRIAHNAIAHVVCFLCSIRVDRDQFEIHLKLHNVFEYHCEICGYGNVALGDVVLHNCLVHPQRNGRIVLRKREFCKSPTRVCPSNVIPHRNPSTSALSLPRNISSSQVSDDGTVASTSSQSPCTVIAPVIGTMIKCGFQTCKFSTSVISDLSRHIDVCIRNINGMSLLYCSLCFCSYKTKQEFLEHLNIHAEIQVYYYCGICNYRARLTSTIKTHLETIHDVQFKQTKCEAKPRDDGSISDWVFKPLVPKLVITNKDGVDLIERKVSPRDRSNLPNKEIFDQEVLCSECDMRFKVRKNMIIHLDQHFKPSGSSPVNSVGLRRNSDESISDIYRPENVIEYVPLSARFICPFSSCTHKSKNKSSLDMHIKYVHEDPLRITCAHCPTVVTDLASLQRHLELHGPQLFKCSSCNYINNVWNIVRGHSIGEHGVNVAPILEVRNVNEQPSSSTGGSLTVGIEFGELGCPCCDDFRCHSDLALRKHLIDNLSLMKYSCTVCQAVFAAESHVQAHFDEVHEGVGDFIAEMSKVCQDFIIDTIAKQKNKCIRDATWQVPPLILSPPLSPQNTPSTSTASSGKTVTSVPAKTVKPPQKKQKTTSGAKTNSADCSGNFRYNCPSCPFSCTEKEKIKLAQHLRLKHLKPEEYICGYCDKTFDSEPNAYQHHTLAHSQMEKHIEGKKDELTEKFIDWLLLLLKDVEGSDLLNRPIALNCEVGGCQMKFTNIYLFKTHFINHITSPSAIDDTQLLIDSRKFKEAQQKEKSISIKPSSALATCFMCPFCNYNCPRSNKLKDNHILRHYVFNFYKCSHCDFDAKSREAVRVHITTKHPCKSVQVHVKNKPKILNIKKVLNETYGDSFKCVTSPEPEPQLKPGVEVEILRCCECSYNSTSEINIRHHCQNFHDLASAIKIGGMPYNKSKTSRVRFPAIPVPSLPGPSGASNIAVVGSSRDSSDSRDTNETNSSDKRSDQSLECSECGKTLENLTHWLFHFNKHHNNKKKKRKISQPNKKPSNGGDNSSVGEEPNGLEPSSPEKYITSFKCCYCDFASVSKSGIQYHWKKYHKSKRLQFKPVKNARTYNCGACSFKTPNLKEGRIHIKKQHTMKYCCDRCHKDFSAMKFLKIHHSKMHGASMSLKHSLKKVDANDCNLLIRAMLESFSGKSSPEEDELHEVSTTRSESRLEGKSLSAVSESEEFSENEVKPAVDKIPNGNISREMKKKIRKRSPVHFESKRRRTGSYFDDEEGFSFYNCRTQSVDWKKLTVNTNLKGCKNATIPAVHLREIFNLDAYVKVVDINKFGDC
ncbi:hypothetical protein CHUAL_005907 [Chamberlinius hualienensis]